MPSAARRTNISELTQGWHAASACEPLDETMPAAWQEGWRLWHSRQVARRETEQRPEYPYRRVRSH